MDEAGTRAGAEDHLEGVPEATLGLILAAVFTSEAWRRAQNQTDRASWISVHECRIDL